jgi:isocitrate/isopropylmalate dehydrogenase
MRQLLDLYICLRPAKAFPGNPLNYREGIDLVVFRREYGRHVHRGRVHKTAGNVFIRIRALPASRGRPRSRSAALRPRASRRIVEAAFQYARKYGRRKVTAVHKANVLRATCGLFLETARQVAARYPDVAFDEANIDAMCMWLLKNPHNYDVIVTTNLFGDILSDLCAQLVGGMGFGYSGNIGDRYADVRAHARLGAQIRGPEQGESHRGHPGGQDDAGVARGNREGGADRASG